MSTPSTILKSRSKSVLDSIRFSKTLTPKFTPSSFFKSVYLENWWLIMAQDKGLAVGGYSCSEMLGARLFSSAAISIRHDKTTLETTDGFTISLSGFINRPRTCENGFPSEVCNLFLLGFPYDWEGYAARCFDEKYNAECVSNECSASGDNSLPVSLDDIPLTRTRDLYMSTLDYSGNWALSETIFEDLIEKLGKESVTNKENLFDLETERIVSFVDSSLKLKKAKVDKNPKKRNKILITTYMKTEKHQSCDSQSKMSVNNPSVSTRSMMKRKRSRNN